MTCRRGLANSLPGAAAGGQTRHISTRQAFKSADLRNFLGLVIRIRNKHFGFGPTFLKKKKSKNLLLKTVFCVCEVH
jgi:hypothetical protein